jgi:hypothetical protein
VRPSSAAYSNRVASEKCRKTRPCSASDGFCTGCYKMRVPLHRRTFSGSLQPFPHLNCHHHRRLLHSRVFLPPSAPLPPTLSTTTDASSLLLCCAAWWADLCGAVGSRILRRRRISHLPRRWVELLASRGLRNGLGRPLGMLTCDGLSEERWQRGSRTNTPGT